MKVLVFIAAALFLFSSGGAFAQGKGKEKGPNESAYEHANEKARFQRGGTEKATEAVEAEKGKGKEAAPGGEGKKKNVENGKKGKGTKAKGKGKKNMPE